ncbi:hypothetical protein [Streptomyces sp. NPDC056600]|uniref:hypothetical protein n=1 Tax=Streptomyces sp. NPDC056600 TaxID=3345874 RepID=UPI0036AF8CCA
MSAGYRFFSWSRQGLAAGVPAGPQGSEGGRAVLPVTLGVTKDGQPDTVDVTLRLYGPGDVLGIDVRQIVRRDPPPRTAQFEPNYFPAVEFDLPDYPWLFSPEASGPRLRPWIVLAVVRKDAAVLRTAPDRPLPWLELAQADVLRELPPLAESWAWAHVQVAGDGAADIAGAPAERTLSRLLCPRKLEPGVSYLACVVPAYEAGRQAGLGSEVTAAGEDAWPQPAGHSGPFELPVYDHWEFSTGPDGDFESLARRLEPVAFGPEIGSRPMDLTTAGSQLPVPPAGEPGAQLGFEGALMSPVAASTQWPEEARAPFARHLVELIDEDGGSRLVAPPLYGSHAVAPPPSASGAEGWQWQLNLDPRHRAAAGLGAQVVAEQQEQLMAAAWDRAGDLERANALLRRAQLARSVASSVQEKRIAPLPADSVLRVTQPLHSRVRLRPDGSHTPGGSATLLGSMRTSVFPEGAVSAAFRRAVRPSGPIGRHLPSAGGASGHVGELTAALAAGTVTVPLKPAKGAVAFDRVGAPKLRRAKEEVPAAPGWTRVFGGDTPVYRATPAPAAALVDDDQGGGGLPPERRRTRLRLERINTRFRDASKALFELVPHLPGQMTTSPLSSLSAAAGPLELGGVAATLGDTAGPVAPERTVAGQVLPLMPADGLVPTTTPGPQPPDPLRPLAAAPDFPQPASEPLREMFPGALLPGAENIRPDTVGVLVGNPRFIESYLVGLNHAMAEELRWRDLPTDYAATFFRQFWSSRGSGGAGSFDIEPIAEWEPERPLGGNATRVGGRGMLVLLVRGELFRRFPHTIVYAVRADTLDGGSPVVRYPEFRGRLDPDMTYLGFGLDIGEARGQDGGPGWYFVLQEQPTGARFGLDALPREGGDARFGGTPVTWADAHWGMAASSAAAYAALSHAPAAGHLAGRPLPLHAAAASPAPPPPTASWGADGAQTAAVTFQRPVRVALYAPRMISAEVPDPALRVTSFEEDGGVVTALAGVDASGEAWRMTAAEAADAVARGAESFVLDQAGTRRRRLVPTDTARPGPTTTGEPTGES